LKQVCGLDAKSLKALYDKVGDAGDVAFEAKKRQSFTLRKPKPLSIKGVYDSLVKIATTQGVGSGERKQRIVDKLLQDARSAEESRYVVRTLCQHLRIGAVKTTMLIALSRAFLLSRPPGSDFPLKSQKELSALKKESLTELWSKAEETVKACFARRPNYNDLVPVLLEIGVCDELLLRCGLTLHIPLMPMLGSITRDLAEMLVKLQGRDFTCEFKYDGQRAQVHCDDKGNVSIFSRHLELMTDKYPDLVALIPKVRGEGIGSFIMEGEVVAVDQDTGELKSFQTLTNRARKDVEIGSITVKVCLFAFDLMYLNGQPLLDRPFRERRSLLRSLFTEVPQQFTWVQSIDATSQESESVLEFFKTATDTKCEGIMVKVLDNLPNPKLDKEIFEEALMELEPTSAPPVLNKKNKGNKVAAKEGEKEKPKSRRKALLATYEPDKRLDSWLKVKKDYGTTFDSLDLIPIAGWHGQGRKSNWWSPILLAVRNETTGSLEAVCKCISGFTDAFYKANKQFYDEGGPNVLGGKPGYVEYNGGYPDVWFEPQEVWEIAFADITISPVYTAAIGLVSEEKGLSLRFPRFLKKREDKGIDEASNSEFLAGLWEKQEAKAPSIAKEIQDEVAKDEELY
jgi:DNA ligase-1